MRRWIPLLLVVAGTATTACSNLPEPTPMRPVAPAAGPLRQLRVHVMNATGATAREAEEDVTGYTLHVRGAVQQALTKAGYVLVVDPEAPRDLVAYVHTDYQELGLGRFGSLVTGVTLAARGGEVAQLSGVVRIDDGANIVADDVADIVESVNRSERVARFASQIDRPEVPCLERMQIAGE